MSKLCAKYIRIYQVQHSKVKFVTHFGLVHLFFFFCTRWMSFAVNFHTGKESGTITYNNSLKYFKTTQDMSIWSLCYLLQRRMLKERCIRKKHVDMSRLKGLRYGLLYVSIITYPQLDICIHNYISIITNPFVYSVQCTVNAKKTLTTTNSYV